MELANTTRAWTARWGQCLLTKRTAKTAFVVVVAMILLQFYWVRELVCAEAAFALVFVVVGLIAVVYAAGWFAVLRLWKLGVGALVSAPAFCRSNGQR